MKRKLICRERKAKRTCYGLAHIIFPSRSFAPGIAAGNDASSKTIGVEKPHTEPSPTKRTRGGRCQTPACSPGDPICKQRISLVKLRVDKVVRSVRHLFRRELEKLCIVLPEAILDLTTCSTAFGSAKRFFAGLLDSLNGSEVHPWTSMVLPLGKRERLALASTLFSGRKLLPDPCESMVKEMRSKHASLMSKPLAADDEFLRTCRRLIPRIFPEGWDKDYGAAVESSVPSLSAAVGHPRAAGGGRVFWEGRRSEFIRLATEQDDDFVFPTLATFTVVVAEGKARGITKVRPHHRLLEPLHSTFYNHLSTQGWLLRGDAKVDRFHRFSSVPGEIFVSGDYESATDGLSLETSEEILKLVLNTATHVPDSVKSWAMSSLRHKIVYGEGVKAVEQQRGQLMGNLLSFPLLCLYNYLAFKHLVPRKGVPVKINGDDIVFRATREEYGSWCTGLPKLGLVLSTGKTFIDSRFFSVNSTYFWSQQKGVRLLPVARLGMLKPPSGLDGIGPGYSSFVRPFTKRRARELAGELFLTVHRKSVKLVGRSLLTPAPYGLGMRVSATVLGLSHLADRECWYLENFTIPRKIPLKPVVHNLVGIPDGWRRSPLKPDGYREIEESFFKDLTSVNWNTSIQVEKEDRASYLADLHAFGGEGYWRRFVAERRCGLYTKWGRMVNRYIGATHKKLPMRLRASVLHDAIRKLRGYATPTQYWTRAAAVQFVPQRSAARVDESRPIESLA